MWSSHGKGGEELGGAGFQELTRAGLKGLSQVGRAQIRHKDCNEVLPSERVVPTPDPPALAQKLVGLVPPHLSLVLEVEQVSL